ncbi:MAG: hypothetical protein GY847_21980 [Proteobacteria bacterium]|nr:hypothetical protein [Pseudomonadota bacterium]
MTDLPSAAIAAFSNALQDIPPEWIARQRIGRRLLKSDPLERFVPARLLKEGMGKLLDVMSQLERPIVLFMDRAGGGDGARAAAGLMPLLGQRWPGVLFIHISFATPSQGLGALVRSILVHTGAENSVNVHVVAYNRPVEGLRLFPSDADAITRECDLIITFSPGGIAGLKSADQPPVDDPLLDRSHLAVLSFPDPESVIGDLPSFNQTIEKEPSLEAIRFWVQIKVDDSFEDLGVAILGPGGDAEDSLWSLLDNARRHPYRILIEPMSNDLPSGDPLVCPCQTVIQEELSTSAAVSRIVPAGSRLVAVARGRCTL